MNMNSNGGPFTFYAMNPDRDQLYNLSLIPPGNSCIAGITEVVRSSGSSNSHLVGFSDACTDTWLWSADLSNATVRSNYARTWTWNDTGTPFTDEIVQLRIIDNGSNCFAGYIFNFNTSAWELKATRCGNSGFPLGYAYWENFGGTQESPNPQCFSMAGSYVWQIRGIQFRYGIGNWSTITANDINGILSDSQYCFNIVALYQIVTGTQPQLFKIRAAGITY